MLTKKDLLEISKLFKRLFDDGFHNNISEYHAAMVKPEFEAIDKRFATMDKKFDNLEHKVDTHYNWLKDDIKGLSSEMFTSVSKAEFNRLKTKVDKYCPAI